MRTLVAILLLLTLAAPAHPWGVRGHRVITEAALAGLPPGLPAAFQEHSAYIVARSTVPDTWRLVSEPFLKTDEDPNHGWFREQFAFLEEIPRSRYEFVLALYQEHLRLRARDPEAAMLTNVRWTGTLPYAAVETFERLKVAFRGWRAAASPAERKFLELDIAHFAGWLSHYAADGSQPLHITIHHDGWQGPNPGGYTTEPRIHGRVESNFVELIDLKAADLHERLGEPRRFADVFDAVLAHLDAANREVETIYRLDLEKAWENKDHAAARELTYRCAGRGARFLRDLIYTAWLDSEQPASVPASREGNPVSPQHPRYNPATGSAPAPRAAAP